MIASLRSEPVTLSGRRLFVTGGTGFLGRCLLDYFIEAADLHGPDFEVTVLSRRPAEFLASHPYYNGRAWLRFVEGDLGQLPPVHARLFTDVIHAAADTHSSAAPLAWLDQLVGGTRNVLDFAVANDVERLLFLSSGAAYGPQPPGVSALREDATLAPPTTDPHALYGQGKRFAEHLCTLYQQQFKLNCIVARCFAVLSEHMPLEGPYAAANFIRDALEGRDIQIRGDGSAVRTYIHGRDAAHWLVTLLRRGRAGEIYNVGSNVPVSILALAQAIAAQAALPVNVVIRNAVAPGPRAVYIPSIEKASQLGLRIETPLHDAIAATLHTLKLARRSATA